jgi:hypothetical protein
MLIIPDTLLNEIMNEVINRWLIPKFNELGMNATGEWLSSLEVRTEVNKGEIWGRQYTEQLVYGRKPGNRPPIAPIERWVNAKLNIHGPEGRSMAFAIANKIAQEGTSWYQQGGTDLIEVLSQPEVTDYVNSRVGNYLQAEAQLQIVRDLKEAFA